MKKLFCALLIMTLVFCAAPLSVNAASDISVWDGSTPNVSGGYAFAGAGTETDPYHISTAADLATLAALVNIGNSFDGYYFTLTADIDLAGKTG